MRVRFWGTRGSIASPGPSTNHFGGNTSCVEMVTNAGKRFIFDCGTGARSLGMHLLATAPKPITATVFLGHSHWDHIQGFPFFAPLFIPGNEFTICAPEGVGGSSLGEVLAGQMEFTYFPVELSQLPAKIIFRELREGVHDVDGVRVITQFLNHPTTTLGYRIEADGVSLLYLTDHEPFSESIWRADSQPGELSSILHAGDRRHAEFMLGGDLLIHDSQYTPEEYPAKKNWGHSTYIYVVELAAAAHVKRVALFHHDPLHDDAKLTLIERRAKSLAALRRNDMTVFCAYEGCEINISASGPQMTSVSVAEPEAPKHEGKMRVLVVDDDPNVRLLAKAALAKEYIVLEAENGQQCMAMLDEAAPDMIVLDLNMPRMGGLEVLAIVRARQGYASLPVLVLTAYGDESNTRASFEAGATDHLTKPFTIPQLATRVHACFARNTVDPVKPEAV